MEHGGKILLLLDHKARSLYDLTGEYECKVDAKGRLRLPSLLIRQIGGAHLPFVLNRGFERHLILYPKDVWDEKTKEINRLNLYDERHRRVIRYFYRGANIVSLDASDRLLITQSLMDYAELDKDVVLFAYQQQIEIWSKKHYEKMIQEEPEDFASIANGVFGQLSGGEHER